MGKWIFALAGLVACVIGGISANQGRVDLIKVSQAALDAPKYLKEGKKAGLLMDYDAAIKAYPNPPDNENFAVVVPKILKLTGKLKVSGISFNPTVPSADEAAAVENARLGLDLAVRESHRKSFRVRKAFDKFGMYDSLADVARIGNALAVRAIVRGTKGDFTGCYEDLQASKRIARLMSLESTTSALRSSANVFMIGNQATEVLSKEWKNDPIKLEALKRIELESPVSFDVDRYLRLSCFGAMNMARNQFYRLPEDVQFDPKSYRRSGLAADARGRFEQTKVLKMFLLIEKARKDFRGNVIELHKSLVGLSSYQGDGIYSPGELFVSVLPIVEANETQRLTLANLEILLMINKLGRWPTLSEVKGDFTIDQQTGEKYSISYANDIPKFEKPYRPPH